MTLDQARKKARIELGRVDEGADPLEEKRAERQAATVSELCDDYLVNHSRREKRPSSIREDEAMVLKIIKPRFGTVKIRDLRKREIRSLHNSMKETPYRANRTLALLSKMFSFAIENDLCEINPCKGVKRYPEEKRTRWVQSHELPHLIEAINQLGAGGNVRTANAIRLLILTGARRGEVLKAKWDEVDLRNGVWTKPSAHTKQKKEHRLPLSAPALEILSRMKDENDGNKYLFPTDKKGRDGRPLDQPLGDIKRSWETVRENATVLMWKGSTDAARLIEELSTDESPAPPIHKILSAAKSQGIELDRGLLNVRLHDLRHTYASHLVSSGLALPIVGQLLGHTQPATTARYAHLADDPLREATNRFGAMIDPTSKTAGIVDLASVKSNK